MEATDCTMSAVWQAFIIGVLCMRSVDSKRVKWYHVCLVGPDATETHLIVELRKTILVWGNLMWITALHFLQVLFGLWLTRWSLRLTVVHNYGYGSRRIRFSPSRGSWAHLYTRPIIHFRQNTKAFFHTFNLPVYFQISHHWDPS